MTTAEVDAVDFEPEEDDLLDDDVPMEDVDQQEPHLLVEEEQELQEGRQKAEGFVKK
jgi:hypothetical protein